MDNDNKKSNPERGNVPYPVQSSRATVSLTIAMHLPSPQAEHEFNMFLVIF